MIYSSIDMRGDWELNDLTTVEESFQQGDLRDGLGLLKWVQSFYDLSSDSGQIKAREAYSKFKFTIDMGVGQLQKTLLDSLSGWSVIGDNDKSNKVKLYDFYKQTRDKFPKQPDSHPIVRVRQMLADLIFNEAQILANVNLTIERISLSISESLASSEPAHISRNPRASYVARAARGWYLANGGQERWGGFFWRRIRILQAEKP